VRLRGEGAEFAERGPGARIAACSAVFRMEAESRMSAERRTADCGLSRNADFAVKC